MERTALTCNSHSRQSRPPTEKGTRKEPRADNSPDLATRATNLLDRGGEYQPRDSASDEAGWRGDGADPRWNEYRQGRRDDVCGLRINISYPFRDSCLLTGVLQGQTPRTTRTQPGNWTGDHQRPAGRAARRGRAGCRVGGTRTGGYGRAHAQYRSCTGQLAAGQVTRGRKVRV